MKPTKLKSSSELEQYIAELKEQIKQAKLDKREALAREQKQAREWRGDLTQEVGKTVLAVIGCDWTRLDLDALREWLADHAGQMHTLVTAPERSPEEAHDALIAFRRGRAVDAKQEARQANPPQEEKTDAEPSMAGTGEVSGTTDVGGSDIPAMDAEGDGETQDTPWTPQGESWQPQQGWN